MTGRLDGTGAGWRFNTQLRTARPSWDGWAAEGEYGVVPSAVEKEDGIKLPATNPTSLAFVRPAESARLRVSEILAALVVSHVELFDNLRLCSEQQPRDEQDGGDHQVSHGRPLDLVIAYRFTQYGAVLDRFESFRQISG